MTEPQDLRFHLVSIDEMRHLYDRNNFNERIPVCRQKRDRIAQTATHELWCCKKYNVQIFDPTTDDEIARFIEQEFVDAAKGTKRCIRRLRIGNDVYELRLPKR